MTFKHTNFEDSMVMRSLEKLAHEKGLIKADPVTVKTASKDTRPSSNGSLVENILHLCAQLRTFGYNEQALEIESKLVSYKKANTLYETSTETGEDLVDRAHPKGSHKLEDVAGDDLAVFETIIDQQLKNIKMVEKTPTGKLANHNDIMRAVKIVLAASKSELLSSLMGKVNFAKRTLSVLAPIIASKVTTFMQGDFDSILEFLNNPDQDNLESAQKMFGKIMYRIKPRDIPVGVGSLISPFLPSSTKTGVPKSDWEGGIESKLNSVGAALSEALAIRTQYDITSADEPSTTNAPQEKATPAAPESDAFTSKVISFQSTVRSWKNLIKTDSNIPDEADKASGIGWLDQLWSEVVDLYNLYKKGSIDEENATARLNRLMIPMNTFKAKWID